MIEVDTYIQVIYVYLSCIYDQNYEINNNLGHLLFTQASQLEKYKVSDSDSFMSGLENIMS